MPNIRRRWRFFGRKRQNSFALIFVKSCHGRVLFRMKTPNVQPASAPDGLRRGERSTSNAQLRSAELSVRRLFGNSLGQVEEAVTSQKRNRAARFFSNLQHRGGCASLEEPFT